jgi:hypothetical protein
MIRKCLTMSLMAVVFNLAVGQFAIAQEDQDAKRALQREEVKARIAKIGTGEKAKIKLELYDKTKLKGSVSAVGAESFTFQDKKTGATTQLDYSQVKKVSREGLALSSKITIGALAAGAAVVLILYLQIYCNEQGC